MHNEGWSTMCGHGIIAVTTMAIERGLIWLASPESKGAGGSDPKDRADGDKPTSVQIRYDTPAGPVQARAHLSHHGDSVRVESVAFRNVASFVFEPSLMVPVGWPEDSGRRRIRRRLLCHRRCGNRRRAGRCRASYPSSEGWAWRSRARSKSCAASSIRTTPGSRGSTERSSPRRLSCPTRICAMSRSSPTPKSIAHRAALEPPR